MDEHNMWIRPIDTVSADDAPTVGGKSANLGELTRAGFAVPAAFTVTTDAYVDAMQAAGVRARLAAEAVPAPDIDDATLIRTSAELAALVTDAPVPREMRDGIVSAYEALGVDVPVAVRSSAPAEDAADTSFAGIHESYTNIIGADAVVRAVQTCWASLWSERARTYRGLRGVTDEPSIAVVVQVMVESEVSGVAFTADPRTGDLDRIVIEAALGLGEVVVGGQVEPDTYVVAKDAFEILDVHLGHQEFRIESTDAGDRRIAVDPVRSTRVLDDEQIDRVARLAAGVEQHYGRPQDLEFAFADGALWIVQTRPITTLDRSAVGGPSGNGEVTPLLTGLGAGPGTATGRVRVLHELVDGNRLTDGEIIVAPMTRPDWLPILRRAGGIVTDGGGITCHAAIVGRELGKPVVVGARTATTDLRDGQVITVDGDAGAVFEGEVHAAVGPSAAATPASAVPGVAPTVTATSVYVNLATPDAAESVAATDVDGVGLLRAEFMITEALAGEHPSHMIAQGRRDEYVAKMADGVARIAAAFTPRPVVYRAIDLRSNEFADLEGGEVEPDEENPMIGYRGCFRYVRDPQLFSLDLDVLHRVRGRCPNVHLMIPFVRTRWELKECLAQLDAHPLGADRRMRRWIMAEVPSVVYWLPEYAKLGIDGVSIGSNDLTQLMLGVDRDSEVCRDLFDTLDPAVLDAIDHIIDRASAAGLTTSLCGQAASTSTELAEHLVRRGITSVSVTPDAASRTRRMVAQAEQRILLDRVREVGR
ncbi:phosphoenolpyruvate synthase [Rhodococcus sp. HNM0563]|uniref:phosphoenolpyruvate synthase n=1 Tax=unclassified Rhodococcus (in: high G+C Gram-positive bacteria) TaxID=192944 RepID=UPI00146B5270|nr:MULTISPECIES: phosphoenolpyruvate synthase [unclassified Rhodococcus (in: high G+C Gram-positive bacteria)]MCK0089662.1 phosphoenolpyruvate synthase [Rhodococcus sp. F64268]NLU62401.1 phosphoenolpyruvate synthase [Rhodococcus sp. HNM0563]